MHVLSIVTATAALLTNLPLVSSAALKDPKCPASMSSKFILHNRAQTQLYAVSVSGPLTSHVTRDAKTRSRAARFGIESVCQGDICGIEQLTYYLSQGKKTIKYGAYARYPGPVYFIADQQKALSQGFDAVIAGYTTQACEVGLHPFGDNDLKEVFDCSGKLVLGTADRVKDCRRVYLTPGKA